MENIARFIFWFKQDGTINEEIEVYSCQVKKSVIVIQRPDHYPKTKHLKIPELNKMTVSGDSRDMLAIGWYEVDKTDGLKELALEGVISLLKGQSERYERVLNSTNDFIKNLEQ